MVNGIFMSTFTEAYGHFLPFITSDHNVALLIIPRSLIKKRKSFRFTNYIADKEDFLPTVEIEWNQDIRGYNKYRVVKKLKAIKQPMRKLNWKNGNLTEKVEVYREKLKASQRDMTANPHNERLKTFEAECLAEYVVHWPNERGADMNTQNLFTTKLSNDEANKMVVDVSDKDIKEAMFNIGENKAPCTDGFTFAFFKKSWAIIRKEICQAVKEFFISGKLLGEINATLITLIPKIPQPNKVSNFRPIACCNVLYKCIRKIITNRIKGGLDKLINVNQSAFVPGKNGPGRCSLKIDIAKAYDIVDWNFLQATLEILVFIAEWYFKSGRGLRQGDPVSPYLFTLIMEVYSLMLARKVKESKKFKFHKGYKEMKLTLMIWLASLGILRISRMDVYRSGLVKETWYGPRDGLGHGLGAIRTRMFAAEHPTFDGAFRNY
ncbi:RNA-directed DNA polymerase, eukaryota, reverse transcriptase zinc-binding domain protein [Tanacetum coccineum]